MRFELPVVTSPCLRTVFVRVVPLVREAAGIRFSMQVDRPARIKFTLPVQYNTASFFLPAIGGPQIAGASLDCEILNLAPSADTEFHAVNVARDANAWGQVFGAVIKHDSTGTVTATIRMEAKPGYGERILLVQDKAVTLFSGVVTEVRKVTGEIGYSVVLTDDLKALADSKIVVPEAEDIADAFREALDEYGIHISDESEKTFFPTYYTGEEVSLKNFRELLESCRGARLIVNPEGGYFLSNTARKWNLDQGKCFQCSDVVDVSGYANRIVVSVDEEYTKWVEAIEDIRKNYGGFSVRTRAKGEQVHSLSASRGGTVIAQEASTWDENNFLVKHSAVKDGIETVTEYTIAELEGFVPVVSFRTMISKGEQDTEKPFMRKEVESVSMGYGSDGGQFLERTLVTQWYEKIAVLSGGE